MRDKQAQHLAYGTASLPPSVVVVTKRKSAPETLGRLIFSTLTIVLFLLAGYRLKWTSKAAASTTYSAAGTAVANSTSWADFEAGRSLAWNKCYDGKFDCARLDVPMDWIDPSEEKRVVLAVIRLPAKSKKSYLGPVFINPGGPGGSGVSFVTGVGENIQKIVGDNQDIISFDPRGVGASLPRIDCFQSEMKREFWKAKEVDVVDAHPGLVYDEYAYATAVSAACERAMSSSGLLEHISTASHARDMLEILTKTGYEKLRYWGFSYGTILGGSFAAMFPDRVERLVSDGNVDYNDWFRLYHTNFLIDADKIMEAFYTSCHKAGPEKCAFYAASPDAVRARLDNLMATLKISPVLISESDILELVTYSKVKKLVLRVFYKPHAKFEQLARVFAALEIKDGIPYYNMQSEMFPSTGPLGFCSLQDVSPDVPFPADWSDPFPAIMCADGELLNETPEEFQNYSEKVMRISKSTGAASISQRASCAGKTVRPKYRFAGPFNATTSFPILFIGNMADNVTPLLSARNNSAGFDDSVVLVQNSYGHCSISAPSTCTSKIVRSYFQDGYLPAPGTECDPDYDLFEQPLSSALGAKDYDLSTATYELSESVNLYFGK